MNTIIYTAIVIATTAGLFSILLTISNRYIANYGKFKMIVNDETVFTGRGGDTLLDALDENAVQIPVLCGGKGTCGSCKVQVTQGSGDLLPIEKINLSAEDQANGYRLACQYQLMNDIKIALPEALLSSQVYRCVVQKLETVSPSIKYVQLQLPAHNTMVFIPGQYIHFICPVFAENPTEKKKTYSLAYYDKKHRLLDLFIEQSSICVSSNYIYNHLKTEDPVMIAGPYSHFEFVGNSPMLVIFDDEGYGCVYSMLKYMMQSDNKSPIHLVYVASNEDATLMDQVKQSFDSLNMSLMQCKKTSDDDVSQITDQINLLIKDPQMAIYLCCHRLMVKALRKHLLINKYPNDHIHLLKL